MQQSHTTGFEPMWTAREQKRLDRYARRAERRLPRDLAPEDVLPDRLRRPSLLDPATWDEDGQLELGRDCE